MLLIVDIETTGLGSDAEIIQLSCITQGIPPFNRYVLPDMKFISPSATKVHGICVTYAKGAKHLEKRGQLLKSVSQQQGLTDFVNLLCDLQLDDSRIYLVAHNGNKFDFPILLRSLREQELLQKFLSLKPLLLDSLTVITEEMKMSTSPLKGHKGKSLTSVYNKLFDEEFNAHDSLDDVIALQRILKCNSLQLNQQQVLALAKEAEVFCKDLERRVDAKERKVTLQKLPISDGMKEKISNVGLTMVQLRSLYDKGGARALLAILALPSIQPSKANEKSKARVTKKTSILSTIITYFKQNAA